MKFTFSNNLFGRFYCWFENEIAEPISRKYYKNKKSHYICTVCGKIEAPYFDDKDYTSLTKDYGWHKIKGPYGGYICHHCADHGYSPSSENGKPIDPLHPREFTWDEWMLIVEETNEKIEKKIKEKDPDYWEYWFNGGREDELFGDWEEEDD